MGGEEVYAPHHKHVWKILSNIFVLFQQITLKPGNFTIFGSLFSVVDRFLLTVVYDKSWKTNGGRIYSPVQCIWKIEPLLE